MASKENKNVKKAMENYEVLTGDEEVKRLAEIRLMSKLEEKSALLTAREEGEEEGIRKVAKNLLKEKIPIEKIAKITGLSEEEIRKIKT